VDLTIEYYTMGHLTKFVRPGARRISSNDSSAVRNVAWRNPDGSKALIAYNTTGNSSANGTRLQIWSCTGTANQKWTVPA